MANLIYPGGAVVASIVLCGLMWLRQRQPRSIEHDIDNFRREREALAPRPPAETGGNPSG
jgi:hypothetical protein